jgi:hypothetical protein
LAADGNVGAGSAQEVVHGAGGDLGGGDGVNEETRPVRDVAASEDVRGGCLVGFAIDLDKAALALDTVLGLKE